MEKAITPYATETSEVLPENAFSGHASNHKFGLDAAPIVVMGSGPVGMRVVTELLDRMPNSPIVIYGEETHQPYDRVRLASWLCGELPTENFVKPF